MKKAINILIEDPEIDKIRKKYDKFYNKIKTHITLVYPFLEANGEELKEHINNAIKDIKPFEITLEGFQKSVKDYYLYLLINKNFDEIIRLYNKFNSGILSKYKNKDMPVYIPHITLGVFSNLAGIDNAIKNLSKNKIKINFLVNKINLLTLDDNDRLIKNEEFYL